MACGAVDWDVWGRFDRWLNCVSSQLGEKEWEGKTKRAQWGFNAAENGKWTWARFGKRAEGGVAQFVTDFREICRVRMRRKGGGGSRRGKKDL